jgi:hypothetical protein
MNRPLDDHAAMYITASRSRLHPPCLGLIQRFDTVISRETLNEHARDLISNPSGMGRRVVRAAVPGARPRWTPSTEVPAWAFRVRREPVGDAELADIIDEEISQQPDPLRGHGWRFLAVPTEDGGMTVINWTNHAFGDARSMLHSVFAPREVWASKRETKAPLRRPATLDEFSDVGVRLRTGVRGSLRLGRDAAVALWKPARHGEELALLKPTVEALRRRRSRVGALSSRRVIALARVLHKEWKRVAKAHGGSSNTLFLAMLGNLIRTSRQARGEVDYGGADNDRELRLLLPIDLSLFFSQLSGSAADRTKNTIISSVVELGPGGPTYGDLRGVRAATKLAIESAVAQFQQASSHRPQGMVDAMQLLPNPIAHRVALRVQSDVDGVASSVGLMPPYIGIIGEHVATDMFLVATPSRTDIAGTFGRRDQMTTLSFVADPALLGPAGTLRERVAAEFDAWGVRADFL